jgi:hypothetical protein
VAGVGVGEVGPLASTESRLTREQAVNAFAKVRLVSAGETFEGRTIAVVTTSIEDVIERCNGDSHNLYAECMLKRMGHEVTQEPGSWTNGGVGPANETRGAAAQGAGTGLRRLHAESRMVPA